MSRTTKKFEKSRHKDPVAFVTQLGINTVLAYSLIVHFHYIKDARRILLRAMRWNVPWEDQVMSSGANAIDWIRIAPSSRVRDSLIRLFCFARWTLFIDCYFDFTAESHRIYAISCVSGYRRYTQWSSGQMVAPTIYAVPLFLHLYLGICEYTRPFLLPLSSLHNGLTGLFSRCKVRHRALQTLEC